MKRWASAVFSLLDECCASPSRHDAWMMVMSDVKWSRNEVSA